MPKAKRQEESGGEDEKLDLFIAPYQQQYSESIHAAREAAQTTATLAWQSNYRRNLDEHRKNVKHDTGEISNLCAVIGANDTYEEAEKDISKAVKRLADERVRFGAWRQRAVQPYESTVSNCECVLHSVMRAASDEERDNPLLHHGLVAKVQERIAPWPRASWDEEAGCVTIAERGNEETESA